MRRRKAYGFRNSAAALRDGLQLQLQLIRFSLTARLGGFLAGDFALQLLRVLEPHLGQIPGEV